MGRKRKPLTGRERARLHRSKMRALGYRIGWVPFKGMEAIGTERVQRYTRMIPIASRNGRKASTWLKEPPNRRKPPKRTSGLKRKSSFRGGV